MTNPFCGGILYKHLREWRNRQTRTFEGRVVIPYGFKSRLSHQTPPFRRWSFSLFSAVFSYEKANRNSLIYKELRLFLYVPKICVPSFWQYFPAQKIIHHLGTFRELVPECVAFDKTISIRHRLFCTTKHHLLCEKQRKEKNSEIFVVFCHI